MKKVLAINSGSSSFKYKLFSFPNEKVIASGMADRVGKENAVFKTERALFREPKNYILPQKRAVLCTRSLHTTNTT